MIDSFPYSKWGDDITAFWTFGPGNSNGTYVLTALGMLVMVASLLGWVWLEHKKLTRQAATLRAAGGFGPRGSSGD